MFKHSVLEGLLLCTAVFGIVVKEYRIPVTPDPVSEAEPAIGKWSNNITVTMVVTPATSTMKQLPCTLLYRAAAGLEYDYEPNQIVPVGNTAVPMDTELDCAGLCASKGGCQAAVFYQPDNSETYQCIMYRVLRDPLTQQGYRRAPGSTYLYDFQCLRHKQETPRPPRDSNLFPSRLPLDTVISRLDSKIIGASQQTANGNSDDEDLYIDYEAPGVRGTNNVANVPLSKDNDRTCSAGALKYSSEKGYLFYGTILEVQVADDEKSCASMCYNNALCESANHRFSEHMCELNSDRKLSAPLDFKFKGDVTTYIEAIKCEVTATSECGQSEIAPRLMDTGLHLAKLSGFNVNGGRFEVRPMSLPWIASIQFNGNHICSGALIDAYFVVTAATCLGVSQHPQDYDIVLGIHTLNSLEIGQQKFKAAQIYINPTLKPARSNAGDIALLRLNQPVAVSKQVRPACLPERFAQVVGPGYYCIAAGWGGIGGGHNVNTLQEIAVPLVDPEACNGNLWYNGQIGPGMICAGHAPRYSRSQGASVFFGSCRPDKGSPLLCTSGGKWFVSGVASWGEGCNRPGKPAVYTEVSHYIDWIKSSMNTGTSGS